VRMRQGADRNAGCASLSAAPPRRMREVRRGRQSVGLHNAPGKPRFVLPVTRAHQAADEVCGRSVGRYPENSSRNGTR
jgi:hypothetical protein